MKKIYIDQHGRFGDILYTIPIARRLMKKGYKVFFYIHEHFSELIQHFPDLNFIEYAQKSPPIPQEPCTLLPLWYAKNYVRNKGDFDYDDLMTCKYKMYNETFDDDLNPETHWHTLTFKRFPNKEKALMDSLGIKDKKYILINENYHYDLKKEIKVDTNLKKVYMNKIEGFSLIDWSMVLENAEEIHTVGTSIIYIIDRLKTTDKLHLYSRKIENVKLLHLLSKEYIYHK